LALNVAFCSSKARCQCFELFAIFFSAFASIAAACLPSAALISSFCLPNAAFRSARLRLASARLDSIFSIRRLTWPWIASFSGTVGACAFWARSAAIS
jgi:hypothetical protein